MAQKDENVRPVTKSPREERLKKLREEAPPIQAEKVKPKIQRVPFMLRQGSRGDQDQPAEIEVSITIHEEASPREERLKKLREEASPIQAEKVKPKIHRVPFMLRQGSRGDQDQPAEIEVSITIHEEASPREERLKKLREEAPPIQAEKVKPKIHRVPFMLRQGSRGDQDQPAEIEVSITIHEEASPREERLKKLREEAPPIQAEKVFMLRQDTKFDKYYEPRVAALGPFHHDRKPTYERAEKIKLKLAANFVKDSKQNDADLLKKVEDNINALRNCYDEEATKNYEDECLAWMLFVDGCSTLEFIYKYDKLEDFQIKRDQVAFVEHDMFLLENQLPYQLLQLLMSSSQIQEKLKESIDVFVWRNSPAAAHQKQQKQRSQLGQDVAIPMEAEPTHLLELLRTTMLGTSPNNKSEKTKGTLPHSFRNVQELQAAGIHFSPSNGNSLRGISFNSSLCSGILSLPQIKVDDSTRPKFMNLIAYEMCPDFHNDFGVTSYICFLDSLIDHPDDVKHLRKKRILQNFLGNDEEVAQLFNEIGTDLVPNDDIYYSVKDQIEKHYNNWGNRVMAQFFHDHFSSPWTVIAFLAALLAVVSSVVQTVYSVLSYHNNK